MSIGIVILAALIVLPVVWVLLPFLLRNLQTRWLRAECRNARAIVLTYDDGPSESVSEPLMDMLKKENVQATFFVLGRNAQALPELVRKLDQDGHEIASHTQNHTNAWKVAPWVSNRDISDGRQTLSALGVKTNLFRPTYGKTTLASLWYQLRNRVKFAYWTVDTRDSWERRPLQSILDEIKIDGGGVVLMHDFDRPTRGPAPDDHVDYVLNTTREIIAFARENKMNLRRFGDLLSSTNKSEVTQ